MKNVVLVVDDSKMIRDIMKNALQDDYEVMEAKDGKEALEIIMLNSNKKFVCVLLDLNMPEYDGFVVLDYLKENNLFSKIPVYIISGDDSKDVINRAFKYNIIDMLNKPFSSKNIKDVVNKAIMISNTK